MINDIDIRCNGFVCYGKFYEFRLGNIQKLIVFLLEKVIFGAVGKYCCICPKNYK